MPSKKPSELSIAATADNDCSVSANRADQSAKLSTPSVTARDHTHSGTVATASAQAASIVPDADLTAVKSADSQSPKEVGGREGLDPVRYGDWEKGGRCIDF